MIAGSDQLSNRLLPRSVWRAVDALLAAVLLTSLAQRYAPFPFSLSRFADPRLWPTRGSSGKSRDSGQHRGGPWCGAEARRDLRRQDAIGPVQSARCDPGIGDANAPD